MASLTAQLDPAAGKGLPLIISAGSVHGERQEILQLLAACLADWLSIFVFVCVCFDKKNSVKSWILTLFFFS